MPVDEKLKIQIYATYCNRYLKAVKNVGNHMNNTTDGIMHVIEINVHY